MTSEDPSMMASSFSAVFSAFLWNLLITFCFIFLILSPILSMTDLHFSDDPSMVQSSPFIQLSGAVKSAARATVWPSRPKGMT